MSRDANSPIAEMLLHTQQSAEETVVHFTQPEPREQPVDATAGGSALAPFRGDCRVVHGQTTFLIVTTVS